MAGYLVLARKYRSTTFDEVVGQEPIARTLVNAIKTGRIAHAYLFTGTRGVGKTTMARILAKALNCLSSEGPTATPCGKCDACVSIARGDDVDVVEIDGASNRGIDEIRELRANTIFRPSRCRFKIYYIDEVHMLTKEAFNALLKTLEEPPEHVKFIFATTETEKVPATILSRCQRYDFRNIPTRLIADHLKALCKQEEVKADDDALFRIARAGAGSMRDALSLLDQLIAAGAGAVNDAEVVRLLGTPGEERTLALVSAIAAGDSAGALKELNSVLEGGVSLASAVAALGEAYRNLMLASVCGAGSELIELPEQQRAAVGELAKKFTAPAIVQAVGIIQNLTFKVRSSSVARALVEAAVVRLAEQDKFVDPSSLLERLEALGRAGVSPVPGRPGVPPVGGTPRAPSYGSRPPAPDVKKNSIVSPSATACPGAPGFAAVQTGASTAAKPSSALQWDSSWLAANWALVIESLTAGRQMQAAGLLAAAKVASLDGPVLRLAYDPAHDTLRQRATSIVGAINAALTALAGREIRCEFVTDPHPGGAISGPTPKQTTTALGGGASVSPAPPTRILGSLSTAEKTEVVKDPAVQAVLALFGGDVVDMKRESLAPAEPEEDR